MTDELSLEGVVRSFEESSKLLDQLRQRLASLASSDEVRQESSDALQRSAGQLAELTSQLSAAVEQLASVGDRLGGAISTAESQLVALAPDVVLTGLSEQRDGLREMSERIESLQAEARSSRDGVLEMSERIETLQTETRSSIEVVTSELEASRSVIERQSAELATLRSKVAGLPDKVRRRHGLDVEASRDPGQ